MGDSDLHRKLLFGRDGLAARPFNEFASQSGCFGENRISLRDGGILPASEIAIAVLGDSWRMRESTCLRLNPRLSFPSNSEIRFLTNLFARLRYGSYAVQLAG